MLTTKLTHLTKMRHFKLTTLTHFKVLFNIVFDTKKALFINYVNILFEVP